MKKLKRIFVGVLGVMLLVGSTRTNNFSTGIEYYK